MPRQKIILDRLRKRTVRDFALQHAFNFRIPARERIAENNDIWRWREIFFRKSVAPLYPETFEQRRGRRINARIRARDAMSAIGQQSRERRHSPAPDSRKMKIYR